MSDPRFAFSRRNVRRLRDRQCAHIRRHAVIVQPLAKRPSDLIEDHSPTQCEKQRLGVLEQELELLKQLMVEQALELRALRRSSRE